MRLVWLVLVLLNVTPCWAAPRHKTSHKANLAQLQRQLAQAQKENAVLLSSNRILGQTNMALIDDNRHLRHDAEHLQAAVAVLTDEREALRLKLSELSFKLTNLELRSVPIDNTERWRRMLLQGVRTSAPYFLEPHSLITPGYRPLSPRPISPYPMDDQVVRPTQIDKQHNNSQP